MTKKPERPAPDPERIGCEGYSAIARVYDYFNAQIDYSRWADYIEACFDRFLPARPELVLDLACGTGRMTRELAVRGYDMIGVDGSAEMLSEALRQSPPGILYLRQDMRSFELYGTVGAVTCCLDSVNYLLTPVDLERCFDLVHNYLDPDGLFLFDVNTPYRFREEYGKQDFILSGSFRGEGRRHDVYCGWQNHYFPRKRLCEFDLSLFEELPDGSYRRSDEHQTERCYTMAELTDTLRRTGFELCGVFGSLSFDAPVEQTQRWHFCARAIKEPIPGV